VDQHVPALISEVKHNGPVKNKVCIVVSHVYCYKGDRQTDRQESGKVDEKKNDTCEKIAKRNTLRDEETDSWDPEQLQCWTVTYALKLNKHVYNFTKYI
jgi:hypothetical protein